MVTNFKFHFHLSREASWVSWKLFLTKFISLISFSFVQHLIFICLRKLHGSPAQSTRETPTEIERERERWSLSSSERSTAELVVFAPSIAMFVLHCHDGFFVLWVLWVLCSNLKVLWVFCFRYVGFVGFWVCDLSNRLGE